MTRAIAGSPRTRCRSRAVCGVRRSPSRNASSARRRRAGRPALAAWTTRGIERDRRKLLEAAHFAASRSVANTTQPIRSGDKIGAATNGAASRRARPRRSSGRRRAPATARGVLAAASPGDRGLARRRRRRRRSAPSRPLRLTSAEPWSPVAGGDSRAEAKVAREQLRPRRRAAVRCCHSRSKTAPLRPARFDLRAWRRRSAGQHQRHAQHRRRRTARRTARSAGCSGGGSEACQ